MEDFDKNNSFNISASLFFQIYDKIISSKELCAMKQYSASARIMEEAVSLLNFVIEDNEQAYSVKETSDYLNVSEKTILRMIKRGDFTASIKGRKYFIKEKEIMEFKNSRKVKKNTKLTTLEELGIIKI